MLKNPITIEPEATIKDALKLLSKYKLICLPVVKNQKLVGIITEGVLLSITNSLSKRLKVKEDEHEHVGFKSMLQPVILSRL